MCKVMVSRIFGVVGTMALLSAMAFSQPPGPPQGPPPGGPGGPGGGIERFFRTLKLSTAQRDKIHSIHENEHSAAEPLIEQIRPLKEQMRSIIEAETFDNAAAQGLIAQIAGLESQLALIHAQSESQIFNVLTAEQKAKLNAIRSQGHPEPPPDGPPGV